MLLRNLPPSFYCFSHVIFTLYLYIYGRDFPSVLLDPNEASSGLGVFTFIYTPCRFSRIDTKNVAILQLNILKHLIWMLYSLVMEFWLQNLGILFISTLFFKKITLNLTIRSRTELFSFQGNINTFYLLYSFAGDLIMFSTMSVRFIFLIHIEA